MSGSKRSITVSVVAVAVGIVTGRQSDALGDNHDSEGRAVVDGKKVSVIDRDTAKQKSDKKHLVIDGKKVPTIDDDPRRVVARNVNDKRNRLIQVAQESKPGKGDFGDNVLGHITPFQRKGTAEVYYGHTGPPGFTGPKPEIEADRSHLFFVDALDGLSLFSVHGPPRDGQPREAVTRIEINGDPDGVVRTVEDDPEQRPRSPDAYETSWPLSFKASYWWRNRNTDGQALTGFDGDWQAVMAFESVPSGVSEWVAYSAHGKEIPLELEKGRRVLLKARGKIDAARTAVETGAGLGKKRYTAIARVRVEVPEGERRGNFLDQEMTKIRKVGQRFLKPNEKLHVEHYRSTSVLGIEVGSTLPKRAMKISNKIAAVYARREASQPRRPQSSRDGNTIVGESEKADESSPKREIIDKAELPKYAR